MLAFFKLEKLAYAELKVRYNKKQKLANAKCSCKFVKFVV